MPRSRPGRSNKGVILLVTLVVVTMLIFVAVGLQFRSLSEQKASSVSREADQARSAALSGIRRAINILKSADGDPALWRDNPDQFRAIPVFQEGAQTWYFTIYAPSDEEGQEIRYGVIDESSKLNINFAQEEQLLKLENLDRELVDCLLDWRDEDDEARDFGAEMEYYGSLQPTGYAPRNGLLVSIEELLLAKGFSAPVIYGEDANLNGFLEPNEDDGDESFPPDNGDGILDRGLSAIATAVTWEPNIDSRGKDRVNINGEVDALQDALQEARIPNSTTRFITLYRADGGIFTSPFQLLDMKYTLTKDNEKENVKAGTKISSGVNERNLSKILDRLSVRPGGMRGLSVGLVNVNTAPAKVLAVLPEIDESIAERIVGTRSSLDLREMQTTAWLYTEGILEKAQFEKVYPYVTARGFQYRIKCVGFSYPEGRFCVLEAVVDLARPSVGAFYIRDLTKLGIPIPLDVEEMEK